ncbi:MAG: response regulator transcription factor [Terriglobia bacterium]|jgi:DNA-binding response OmpR family regulator
MRVLIADDEATSRHLIQATLGGWGFEVLVAVDGWEALRVLQGSKGPEIAMLDWMMPGIDGLDVCRRMRATMPNAATYIILVTARGGLENVVRGLEAGADDYITKPFDPRELRARLHVGVRIVQLQKALMERFQELEDALKRVKQLQGLLPICSYCKKIRNDRNYWEQVDAYITSHSEAQFSHGVCPDCYEIHLKPQLARLPNCEEEE